MATRTKHKLVRAGVILALFHMATPVGGQNKIVTNLETARNLISGKSQRVWIAEAVKAPLGGTSCEMGQRYRFQTNETAEVESCLDGSWETTTISWSISGGGVYLLKMVLEGTPYEATLVRRSGVLELVLEEPATDKDIKTSRIDMNYALD